MYEYKAKVIKVIDGDTIDLDIILGFNIIMIKQRVRLYNIDTPESRTRDLVEKTFGLYAKAFLKQHCPVDSIITIHTHLDKKGKFGRILGELYVKGININEKLLTEHFGVRYTGQNKTEIAADHLANRQLLIEAGYSGEPYVKK